MMFAMGCENTQKTNGFVSDALGGKGMSWHMGNQSAVDVVTELDKAWSSRDFNKMRIFFEDTATFEFAEGHKFKSVDGFIEHVKKQFGDQEANWTYDYAVAIDLKPGEGGEWVNAGFTADHSDTKKDTSKIYYNEWNFIVDGKIRYWSQSRQISLEK